MHIDWQSFTVHDDTQIRGFFGEFRWCSNFHVCEIHHEGGLYASTEHAYMASKCKNEWQREQFQSPTLTCSGARRLGQQVALRDNWEDIKFQMMLEVNIDKYTRHKDLRDKLLATGSKYIEETNVWNDVVWGYDVRAQKGQNRLGEILMRIRDLLQPPWEIASPHLLHANRISRKFAAEF